MSRTLKKCLSYSKEFGEQALYAFLMHAAQNRYESFWAEEQDVGKLRLHYRILVFWKMYVVIVYIASVWLKGSQI